MQDSQVKGNEERLLVETLTDGLDILILDLRLVSGFFEQTPMA